MKSLLGTSLNAVKTPFWILVFWLLKFQSKAGASLQRMLRILQFDLFS